MLMTVSGGSLLGFTILIKPISPFSRTSLLPKLVLGDSFYQDNEHMGSICLTKNFCSLTPKGARFVVKTCMTGHGDESHRPVKSNHLELEVTHVFTNASTIQRKPNFSRGYTLMSDRFFIKACEKLNEEKQF